MYNVPTLKWRNGRRYPPSLIHKATTGKEVNDFKPLS